MKTPEEIKKGLEVCCPKYDGAAWINCYLECPYKPEGHWCKGVLHTDALAYINQLEQRIAQAESERDELSLKNLFLETSLESVTKEYTAVKHERDAAVADMENYCHHGSICKHFCEGTCPYPVEGCPLYPSDCDAYEWRGVCEENSK